MKTKGNAPQKLPGDHFNSNGTSQGKETGAVRKTYDAHNEHMDRAQKPEREKRSPE